MQQDCWSRARLRKVDLLLKRGICLSQCALTHQSYQPASQIKRQCGDESGRAHCVTYEAPQLTDWLRPTSSIQIVQQLHRRNCISDELRTDVKTQQRGEIWHRFSERSKGHFLGNVPLCSAVDNLRWFYGQFGCVCELDRCCCWSLARLRVWAQHVSRRQQMTVCVSGCVCVGYQMMDWVRCSRLEARISDRVVCSWQTGRRDVRFARIRWHFMSFSFTWAPE